MEEITTNVNWLAVGLGAIISFVVGWLWYSPKMFGVKWAEGMKVELGDANDMPVGAMVAQMIGLILMSWFVGVTASKELLATVILATLAFTVLGWSRGAFAQNSNYANGVGAGYWILALVIMIALQGIL